MTPVTHRRSRLQQSLDVLEAVSAGLPYVTMVNRRTGLPWNVVKHILDGCVLLGYLTVEDVGRRKAYRLTKKGRLKYLRLRRMSQELEPLLNSDGQPRPTD